MTRSDDRGSMPLAMLLVLVGTSLSAILAGVVVTSVRNSDYGIRREQSLNAAQAGLDAARAQIRGAADGSKNDDGDDNGDAGRLPCGPLNGYVDAAGTVSYSVQIRYYATDPQAMDDAQRATSKIGCSTLYGPDAVPAYALFTATGTAVRDKTATRTLEGTYIVHTNNANISGGLIHVTKAAAADPDMCLDAGSGDPAVNDVATIQPCNAGKLSQAWQYMDTLQIQLVSSQTPAHKQGMCLDSAATHANNNKVYMGLCETVTPAQYRQAWSFDDSARLVGSNKQGTNVDSYCFKVASTTTNGSGLYLITPTSSCSTWSADANVGAGAAASAAGRAVGMLVNYQQFGRCLDVTEQNITYGYMIAWPCKQNPDMSNVTWNQRYTLPALPSGTNGLDSNKAVGVITTTKTGTVYCLQSPQVVGAGNYVNPKACVTGQNNQQWTVYGRTASYATSYQIVDGTGKYCLQPDPSDLYSTGASIAKIKVATCNGSTLQKWNASKNVTDALALKDLNEKATASGGS
jgi:type II secretory pathway pseudopilin PulG